MYNYSLHPSLSLMILKLSVTFSLIITLVFIPLWWCSISMIWSYSHIIPIVFIPYSRCLRLYPSFSMMILVLSLIYLLIITLVFLFLILVDDPRVVLTYSHIMTLVFITLSLTYSIINYKLFLFFILVDGPQVFSPTYSL